MLAAIYDCISLILMVLFIGLVIFVSHVVEYFLRDRSQEQDHENYERRMNALRKYEEEMKELEEVDNV